MDFQPVRRRELQMGQHLRLGLIHQGGGFKESAGGVDRRPAAKQPGRWPRRVGRRSGARYRRVTGWSWGAGQQVTPEMYSAPLPTAVKTWLIAAFKPSWASK